MSYVDAINAFELVWWIALGVIAAVRSWHSEGRWRYLGFIAAATLVMFGISDGVELWTKAWWKPWWLLTWKAACITVLVGCIAARARLKRQDNPST
jgi:hypothetical protein